MNKTIITVLLLCTVRYTAGFVIIDDDQLLRCKKLLDVFRVQEILDAFRVQERSNNLISSIAEKAGVVFWHK